MAKNYAVLKNLFVVFVIVLPLVLDQSALSATPVTTATHNLGLSTHPSASSSILWGAYIDGVPWDMTKLAAFERDAQKAVAIVHWSQSWINGTVYQPFYPGDFDTVYAHGSLPLLDWGSWDYTLGPNQRAFALKTITGGRHDAYITQWAQAARAWGHPLFLRFDWEMNGNWKFPWSIHLNGNSLTDFVPAWQHVHDIFTRVGATNVMWVWSPNIVTGNSTPLAALYPGDAYVDWVSMDGYNWGKDNPIGWQTFAQVFGTTYAEVTQLAPSKSIMLAEVASSERGGSKAMWITDALQTQIPNNFRHIKAVVWFNWNDNNPVLTWPIESSRAATHAFATAIASPIYATNHFGSQP